MGIDKRTAIAAEGSVGEKWEPKQQRAVGIVSSEPECSEKSLSCAPSS